MSATTAGSSDHSNRVPLRSLAPPTAAAVVLAVAANLSIRAVGLGPIGVHPDFPPLQSVGGTIVASVVGVLAAALVFVLLMRFVSRPVVAFRVVAVVGLLLSLGGPISAGSEPGGSTGAVLVLLAMHVVTAAIAVAFLTSPAQRG